MIFGSTDMYGVSGEYGLYGQYVYPEEYLPADESLLDEQWAPVDEDPDYWVSTHGRVWSAKSMGFVKPKRLDRRGHVGICVHRKGGQKALYRYLHRLMAECFLQKPDGCNIVRHLDDDPKNNCIDNLAWGTQKDNMHDCIENGNFYYISDEDRRKGLLGLMIPVIATNLKTGEERLYESLQAAADDVGVFQANAWKVMNGQRKHTKGYSFRKA